MIIDAQINLPIIEAARVCLCADDDQYSSLLSASTASGFLLRLHCCFRLVSKMIAT